MGSNGSNGMVEWGSNGSNGERMGTERYGPISQIEPKREIDASFGPNIAWPVDSMGLDVAG
jgi:hypothetical protein